MAGVLSGMEFHALLEYIHVYSCTMCSVVGRSV